MDGPQSLTADLASEKTLFQPSSQSLVSEIQADENSGPEDTNGAKAGNLDGLIAKEEQENETNYRESHQSVDNARDLVQNLGQGFETRAVMTDNQEQM